MLNRAAEGHQLVQKQIQEISDALEAFKAGLEAGERTGFQNGSLRAHDGT